MAARTTIQLDADLAQRLRDVVAPRGINRFINEAVAEKLGVLERQRLVAELREGYEAAEQAQAEISSDWDVVDLEDWPK